MAAPQLEKDNAVPIAKLPTGIDLHFETTGNGEPLVLIPSTGLAGNIWHIYQVPELAKQFQVITFDPRGCGRTAAPDSPFTIDQLASDLAALLDHLDIRAVHLLGHSMGGRIAIAFALAFPRRIKSLILAASGSGIAARPGDECVPGLSIRMMTHLIEAGFDSYIRSEFTEKTTYFTQAYLDSHPDKVQEFFDIAWRHHAKLRPYLRLVIARQNWEATHRLAEISAPTLVVIGDHDAGGSNHLAQAERLLEGLPNAEQLVLKDQAHGFFWQAPDDTNRWIADWVNRHAQI